MLLNMRISTDSAGTQRFTESEILQEIANDNIFIVKGMVLRQSDNSVMGEILQEAAIPDQVLTDEILDDIIMHLDDFGSSIDHYCLGLPIDKSDSFYMREMRGLILGVISQHLNK